MYKTGDKPVEMCIKDKSLSNVRLKDLFVSVCRICCYIWIFIEICVIIASFFSENIITFHVKSRSMLFMKHIQTCAIIWLCLVKSLKKNLLKNRRSAK